jgi:YVTN family beta-propeller protein
VETDASFGLVKHLRGEGFTVVDTSRDEVVGAVGRGRQPHTVAVHPNGRWGYVPYMASNSLEVIDLWSPEVASENHDVGTAPVGATVTRTGNYLFVSSYGELPNEDAPGLAVFETDDEGGVSRVAELPVGKAAGVIVDAANDVWVALNEACQVVRLDGQPPFEELDRFSVPGDPQDTSFSREYGLLGVNNVEDGSVTFFDTLGAQRLATVEAPNPRGGTAAPAARRWFVGNTEGDGITVVDLENVREADGEFLDDATETVETGSSTAFTDVRPDGRLLVVDAYDDDRVTFLDPGSLELVQKIRTGGTPHHPRFSVDGRRCYVPNEDDDTVSVLDTGGTVHEDTVSKVNEIQLPDGVAPSGFFLTDRR